MLMPQGLFLPVYVRLDCIADLYALRIALDQERARDVVWKFEREGEHVLPFLDLG
jgi:hypothetical protein